MHTAPMMVRLTTLSVLEASLQSGRTHSFSNLVGQASPPTRRKEQKDCLLPKEPEIGILLLRKTRRTVLLSASMVFNTRSQTTGCLRRPRSRRSLLER